MRCRHLLLCALPLVLASCTYEDATDEAASTPAAVSEQSGQDISVPDAGEISYEPSALEQMRRDASWRTAAERDREARAQAAQRSGQAGQTREAVGVNPGLATDLEPSGTPPPIGAPTTAQESFDQISPDTLARAEPRLPIASDGGGPTTLRAQILLDRVRFSPGVMDGKWGQNTAKAAFWFQDAHGLPTTGEIDRATWDALARQAGGATEPLRRHRVTAEDLRGPFIDLPDDVYARADLDCLCYESPLEMFAEQSHSTPDLLRKLNPQVNFDSLQAGQEVWLPNVTNVPVVRMAQAPPAGQQKDQKEKDQKDQQASTAEQGQSGTGASGPGQGTEPVAELVISQNGSYVHALDGQGRLLFHFPSTLGSRYDPSPEGDYKVTGVHPRPDFHYQPKLFADVPDTKKDVYLPPGPNSPVGLVWMQLSKPNYGIHGTAVPETIGYASSHGCVRLTNWDALYLSERIPEGVPVRFVE